MQIDFDEAKDASNIEKHGISLAKAVELDWHAALAAVDERQNYGEERLIGFAPLKDRLYCVVFTVRGNTYRIISLRRANSREVAKYEQAQID